MSQHKDGRTVTVNFIRGEEYQEKKMLERGEECNEREDLLFTVVCLYLKKQC